MEPDLWNISSLGAYAVVLWQLLKGIRRLILHWVGMRKAVAPTISRSTRDPARFLSALIFVLAITFGVLLLLAVISQQTSPASRSLVLVAGGVGGLALLGALLMVIGVPAYNYTMDLKDRCQRLEERVKAIEVQTQVQNEFLDEQFPQQRKLAFMENAITVGTRGEYTS